MDILSILLNIHIKTTFVYKNHIFLGSLEWSNLYTSFIVLHMVHTIMYIVNIYSMCTV